MPTLRSGKSFAPFSASLSSQNDNIRMIKRSKTKFHPASIVINKEFKSQINLPNEIIHQIISHMASQKDRSTLASVCRVSKNLYKMASPLLGNHLVLSPWRLNERDTNGGLLFDKLKATCGHLKTERKNSQFRDDVKIFSVYHHPLRWCLPHSTSTLQLPSLHTVYIYLNHRDSLHPDFFPDVECRLIRSLRPEVIVIHDIHNASKEDSFNKAMSVSDEIFEHAEVIVFTSFLHRSKVTSNNLFQLSCKGTLKRLKTIYWVFDPTSPRMQLDLKQKPQSLPTSCHTKGFVELASQSITMNASIVFVNVTAIDRHSSSFPKKSQLFKLSLESGLHHGLIRLKLSHEERSERIENQVNFISLEEFKESNRNGKYLDEDQVNTWLTMMNPRRSTKRVVKA